jgi:hypothetical protein
LAYVYAFGKITLGYVQFGADGFEAVLYRGHGYIRYQKMEKEARLQSNV